MSRPPGSGSDRTARGFDILAPAYATLADLALAGRIHRSQVALLPLLPAAGRALVLGDGPGRFLAELAGRGLAGRIVAIDVSPAMTRRAARRLARHGADARQRVELRVGGLERLAPEERFDLVATHCFLDLFGEDELEGVMALLAGALEPGGTWLFSDFAVDGPGLPAPLRRAGVAGLYLFFRAACGISARRLPDFGRAFAARGLEERTRLSLAGGLLRAALYRKPPA